MSETEEKLFGKYNEFVLMLLGFLLTGVIGTYISQTYTTKNAELSAANKIFGDYSKLSGDRYFTMNQVMIGLKEGFSENELKKRWESYRIELQRWNSSRGYNRQMLNLYFGQPLWNQERNIHYMFRAWGQSLESANKDRANVDFDCLESFRNNLLIKTHDFSFALAESIQKDHIGSSKTKHNIPKSPRPEPPCLTN